jgi:hypothetical protein
VLTPNSITNTPRYYVANPHILYGRQPSLITIAMRACVCVCVCDSLDINTTTHTAVYILGGAFLHCRKMSRRTATATAENSAAASSPFNGFEVALAAVGAAEGDGGSVVGGLVIGLVGGGGGGLVGGCVGAGAG